MPNNSCDEGIRRFDRRPALVKGLGLEEFEDEMGAVEDVDTGEITFGEKPDQEKGEQ